MKALFQTWASWPLTFLVLTMGCAQVTLEPQSDVTQKPGMDVPGADGNDAPQLLPNGQPAPNSNPSTPANPPKEPRPTGPGCSGMVITQPLPQSVADDGIFIVKGTVQDAAGLNITTVQVNGQTATLKNDSFVQTLELPDGDNTFTVRCGVHQRHVNVTAGLDRPWITVEEPAVGAMIPGSNQPVRVAGRVDSQFGIESLMINEQPVQISQDGRFEYSLQPTPGMNHIMLAARSNGGAETDLVRSFVYGKFRPFKGDDGPGVIRVSPSGLNVVSEAIAKSLNEGGLEEAVEPNMGRNGDIELHEIRFDDINVDTEPVHGGLKFVFLSTISDSSSPTIIEFYLWAVESEDGLRPVL